MGEDDMKFDFEAFLARSSDADFKELTISQVLRGLPPIGANGPWLAGGAVRRTVLGEEPKSDFDFFFRDADQLKEFCAGLEQRGFIKVKETTHHIHYKGNIGGSGLPRDIQAIRFAFYPDADAVIDSFDFTICQFAFDGKTLTAGDYALFDLGRKRLAVHKLTFPVSSMRRMLKYTKQGFTACSGAIATILRETAQNPALAAAMGVLYVD
jgi:hypothetical protein